MAKLWHNEAVETIFCNSATLVKKHNAVIVTTQRASSEGVVFVDY